MVRPQHGTAALKVQGHYTSPHKHMCLGSTCSLVCPCSLQEVEILFLLTFALAADDAMLLVVVSRT